MTNQCALVLRWMIANGKGVKAAASHFGVPLGTVKSWKRRHWSTALDESAATDSDPAAPPLGPRQAVQRKRAQARAKRATSASSTGTPRPPSTDATPGGGTPKPQETVRVPRRGKNLDVDHAVTESICEGLRLGLSPRDACARIGVKLSTHQKWMQAGRRAREYRDGVSDREVAARDLRNLLDEPRELTPSQQSHCDHLEAVERAEANLVTGSLALIHQASKPVLVAAVDRKGRPILDPKTQEPVKAVVRPGDWKAQAWLLERLRPADFGKRTEQVTRHTGVTDDAPIRMAAEDLSGVTTEELTDMRKRVEELRALKRARAATIGEA